MANSIVTTACDNELVILAYTPSASYELCQILSGNSQPVNVTLGIVPGQYVNTIVLNGVNQPLTSTVNQNLPSGTYSILMLGVNWGGPTQFKLNINGISYSLPLTPEGGRSNIQPWPNQHHGLTRPAEAARCHEVLRRFTGVICFVTFVPLCD